MKTIILLTTILLSTFRLMAQDFAPVGSEWYYTESFVFSGDKDYLKITSIKDTTYQGKLCHKLIKEKKLYCLHRPDIEYIYSEDSVVYFWDADFNEFQKLYDFTSKKDSSWVIKIKDSNEEIDSIIISVDSTDIITINESQLKVLYVTYTGLYHNSTNFSYNSKIVDRIGDFRYLFNLIPESAFICDANESDGLRCYEDSEFGFYSTGIADSCTYTYKWKPNDIDDVRFENYIQIFPNPTKEKLQVNVKSDNLLTLQLFDLFGRQILFKNINSNTFLDLSELSKGFYLVTIKDQDRLIEIRKIFKN